MNDNQIRTLTPEGAYTFAVERGFACDVSRRVASQNPHWAYNYARDVDKGPHEVTRKGASMRGSVALDYARWIDKAVHPETFEAVKDDVDLRTTYMDAFYDSQQGCER